MTSKEAIQKRDFHMKKQVYGAALSSQVIALIFICGCIHRFDHNTVKKIYINHYEQELLPIHSHAKTITIWIHGTRLFPGRKKDGRNNGLQRLDCLQRECCACALAKHHPDAFCSQDFYYFCWSGKLSFTERYKAAELLYGQLSELIANYKKRYNHTPHVRIITHSHGGNIALNLARIKYSNDVFIDELIMLACPVQMETKHLIHDPLFKQVFALYSCLDFIQVLDPQWFHNTRTERRSWAFFSERCFPTCDKLFQAKIKINKRAITHHEFVRPYFLKHLPLILRNLQDWYEEEPLENSAGNVKRLLALEM